jgi:hypothetical protein
MMTRRQLLTASAASVVFSAGPAPRAAAQSRLTTAHILTGYTPGLPDAVARLIGDQMKDYAASIVIENPARCEWPCRGGGGESWRGRRIDHSVRAARFHHALSACLQGAPIRAAGFHSGVDRRLIRDIADCRAEGAKRGKDACGLRRMVPWQPEARDLWHRGCWDLAAFHRRDAGARCRLRVSSRPLSRQGRNSGPAERRDRVSHLADRQLGALVQSGELRALATTGPRRSPLLPDVPTMAEAGYPALEDLTWYGFFVPAKTPPDKVERLNSAIQRALRTEEVKSGIAKLSVEIDAIATGEFARLLASEARRWKAIVQTTAFTPTD